MGVAALWSLLEKEGVVEHYRGASSDDYAAILQAASDAVVAVDLSPWLLQADQQAALAPHFSREERCMKVAFERVGAAGDKGGEAKQAAQQAARCRKR
jgi:hypothetical protein